MNYVGTIHLRRPYRSTQTRTDIQDETLLGDKNENGFILKWVSFTREGGKLLEARKFRGLFNHRYLN